MQNARGVFHLSATLYHLTTQSIVAMTKRSFCGLDGLFYAYAYAYDIHCELRRDMIR